MTSFCYSVSSSRPWADITGIESSDRGRRNLSAPSHGDYRHTAWPLPSLYRFPSRIVSEWQLHQGSVTTVGSTDMQHQVQYSAWTRVFSRPGFLWSHHHHSLVPSSVSINLIRAENGLRSRGNIVVIGKSFFAFTNLPPKKWMSILLR